MPGPVASIHFEQSEDREGAKSVANDIAQGGIELGVVFREQGYRRLIIATSEKVRLREGWEFVGM